MKKIVVVILGAILLCCAYMLILSENKNIDPADFNVVPEGFQLPAIGEMK